jgi:2-succinyl-6-hydroxy-2,4-cyclohexadiene-1-carboxylate synthase
VNASRSAFFQPGPPGAPAVLAVHGFTGGGADFAPLAAALPELTWRAPDLPGHAPDPAAPGAPGDDCGLEATLRYLDDLPDAGVPEILLGYSLGARVALRSARARPHRFAALILIGASAGLADPAERAARRIEDERLAERILAHGVPAFLDAWRQRPLIATQERLPEDWKQAMRARRLRLRAAGLAASLRGSGQAAWEPAWEWLPQLSVPVLLAAGAEDSKYLALAETLCARLPVAELMSVPNAGHLAHLENLPAFASGLHAFLARRKIIGA